MGFFQKTYLIFKSIFLSSYDYNTLYEFKGLPFCSPQNIKHRRVFSLFFIIFIFRFTQVWQQQQKKGKKDVNSYFVLIHSTSI